MHEETRVGLAEKSSVVVGGTSGLGLVIARRLAELGSPVAIIGRDRKKGEAAAAVLGNDALFIESDIGDHRCVDAAFDELARRFQSLHFAVNCAGVTGGHAPIRRMDTNDWDRLMKVNCSGVFYCLRREIEMIRRTPGGAIVNVSSCAGALAIPNQAAYVSSKAALNLLTQVAAIENAVDHDDGFSVRVNAVAPGPILGGMNTPERLAADPDNTRRKIDVTAMKRFARPEEVAASVLYLLGPGATYVTGAILDVDGGYRAGKF
ncbi:SDR family NAD(P)-dependent oxidoreductase [Methylosinus sp. Ce-a6]|uniref:SDR family NAD(P)-dependent oxidoreductase n=1 Tax=Methylosinus sp. Ce-a6 TaxID=2172005 RepID=UPI001FCE4623|nr:SDR family oxidoreductase [Methylosinus sp. Ce-a6]